MARDVRVFSRPILNAILRILRIGAPWKDLPARYPPRSTVHRHFQDWNCSSVLDRVLQALYELFAGHRQLNLSEYFIDATFASAKKGAWTWARRSAAGDEHHSDLTDAIGLPIAIHVASASPREVTLVYDTLDATFDFDHPQRLIGDRVYDSDVPHAELVREGIEMTEPNRRNRSQTQDGRPLYRSRRRWRVERFFAWLYNFRCLVVG